MKRRNSEEVDANKKQRVENEEKPSSEQLFQAIEEHDSQTVSNLLQSGADPNEKNVDGETALILATKKGYLKIAKELLKHSANVNQKNNFGENPLLAACTNGKITWVRLFLKNNCDPNVKNKDGQTPLLLAFHKKHLALCELFIKNGVKLSSLDGALINAVKTKSKDTVRFLLKHGHNVNEKNHQGFTPLSYACGHGLNQFYWKYKEPERTTIMTLLKNGADPNVKVVNYNANPLMLATYYTNVDAVEALLEHGADPNQTVKFETGRYYPPFELHESAIMQAAKKGNLEIFELFMKHQPDLQAKNGKGQTALMIAANHGHFKIFDALAQRGADLNVIDKSENNSLTLALRNGHKKIANSLLDKGIRVDPQKIHRNGETTMMLAARCGTAKVAVALIQKGADVHARDANGRTALMHASHCGALKVVKKLVEFEADVNIKDNEGKSAIDFSFGKRNDKITVHLLEYGAGENLDTYFVPPSKVRQQREKIYRRIRRIESVLFPDDTPVIAQLIAEFTFGVRYLTNYIEKHSYKD